MILVSKTYQTITYESAEHGEVADSGFEFENESVTFRELVELMREHYQPSRYPLRKTDTDAADYVWLSSGEYIDYRTGESTITSIHYSRTNPARNRKYWIKAAVAAGIAK